MAIFTAFEKLYDDCVTRFGLDGTFGVTPTPVAAAQKANRFGWREPPQQLRPTVRIEWVPGDPAGKLGEALPPKWPGRTGTRAQPQGRPLATLGELFTCYLHGFAPAAPRDERAQYNATRLLYDAWYRAVYLAAHGTFAIKSSDWLIEKNEKRFGATVRVVGIIESMIPDKTVTFAPADVGGEFDVIELDQTETVIVDPP